MGEKYRIYRYSIQTREWIPTSFYGEKKVITTIFRTLRKGKLNYVEMRKDVGD